MSWLSMAVIGGINLDILGMPEDEFRFRDSIIGHVRFACGGVGRNIAAQAVRTGADVSLYTVFGTDQHAEWLRQACLGDGIRIDRAVTLPGNSPTYMAIHGQDGDMVAAINDMSLLDALTPDLLDRMLPAVNTADVCIVDANLTEESLLHIGRAVRVPLLCDPVSVEKALRIRAILPRLTAIKPNLMEAQALTGAHTPEHCADALLSQGVKNVFISLGKDGLYYADRQNNGYLRPAAISVKAQTGAGDALMAGIASGIGRGLGIRECAMSGMREAARHLQLR